MSKKPSGGPAFPCLDDCEYESGHALYLSAEGMSLRDWFAGQAAEAFVSLYAYGSTDSQPQTNPASCAAEVARLSYQLADAMLAEREKGGSACA
jgi:hypothetical protein